MQNLRKGLNGLTWFLEKLMTVALIVMVAVMFMQVVLRYVFSTGFAWTEELTRFLMVYMIFIGAAVLTSYDGHISVTILDDLLKGNARKVLKVVQYGISLLYCFLMCRAGFNSLAIVSMQKSPNMQISMNWIYIIMPIGMILMMVYIVGKLILMFADPEPEKEGEAK